MNCIYIGVIFLLSVFLTSIIIPRILFISYKKRLFDIPDERKVHKIPVPRLGGLSFFPVIFVSVCIVIVIWHNRGEYFDISNGIELLARYLLFISGLTILYLIGVADDLVGVGYRYKFIIQIIAGILFPISGLWINNLGGLLGIYSIPAYIGMPLTVFLTVYVINAINLIDGIDGLASGLSCIALTLFTIICFVANQDIQALLASSTLGVVLVFFYYNVFSGVGRKLFMGDAGSLTLGYILSFLLLHFWEATLNNNPFDNNLNMVAFSTLLIPVLDIVRVFYNRVHNGRNPFLPDKNHIHHKLLRTGMRVRWVMVSLLLLSLFIVLTNYILSVYINATYMLLIDLIYWVIVHYIINYYIVRRENVTGKKWNTTYK